ncbi:MAG TPA: outer membrane beta-barrel protein [Bacteroidia bacterium]|nr:outer membrane beta-barrel protein [Bacteroidia bacterium]HRH09212.1 outer membrane beta-barrel protein [Bacteroidia bacterium]
MKQLIIFLFTLTTLCSYGQTLSNEKSSSNFKRVQIGINISLDNTFRKLKNNDGSSTVDDIIKIRNENETFKSGYTTGLNVCFNIKNNVGLETGIQYSNKGYQTKKEYINFALANTKDPNYLSFIYSYHYIDIPVKANFTIGKRKVRFLTSFGITTNIFIKETQKTVLFYSDHSDKKTTQTNFNYNKVNITPTISVGIDYKINSRMNLRVEPTFRYGILKITNDPLTGYLYSAGLNISYYFGF